MIKTFKRMSPVIIPWRVAGPGRSGRSTVSATTKYFKLGSGCGYVHVCCVVLYSCVCVCACVCLRVCVLVCDSVCMAAHQGVRIWWLALD